MSAFAAIINFFKSLFGLNKKKEEKAQPVPETKEEKATVVLDPSKEMSDAVEDFLVNGHPLAEQEELRNKIHENEAKGIYEYDLVSSKWLFHIKNGQINRCATLYEKPEIVKPGCMSRAVMAFLVQGHPAEEQKEIEKFVREQEAKGIYEYQFSTSRWAFHIKNGQINGCSTNVNYKWDF